MSSQGKELTTFGVCLTLERPDGIGLATTSCDRALRIDETVFEPVEGLMPHAIHDGTLDEPATEIGGALSTNILRADDLRLGRWDGARVRVAAAEWEGGTEFIQLTSGTLGEVTTKGFAFGADVETVPPRMKDPACPATTPECRATLGDRQCRINLAPLRTRARVTKVDGAWLEADRPVGEHMLFGTVRFLSGRYCGLSRTIVGVSTNGFRVQEDVSSEIADGDRVLLTQGCDKRAATCRTRFANMINFRGEPHVPGTDLLMRYPGL